MLNLNERSYGTEEASHQHQFHQLVLPLRGDLELETNNTQYRVREEQGVFIRAQDPHSYLSREANRFIVLDIPAGLPGWNGRAPGQLTIDPSCRSALLQLDGPLRAPLSKELKAHLGQHLLRQLIPQSHQKLDRRLERMLTYVARHRHLPISVKEMAEAACLSPRQFQQQCRAQLGLSPRDLLLQERMVRASLQLYFSALPITQIALDTGYQDLTAFSHRFRRWAGMGPRELRRLRDTTGDTAGDCG